MSKERKTLLDTITDFLHSTALDHAECYQEYGEALERYGKGEINSGALFKTAGNLYIREASRCGSHTIEAASEAYEWLLGKAGVRTLRTDKEAREADASRHDN